jgi:hypothetical protein
MNRRSLLILLAVAAFAAWAGRPALAQMKLDGATDVPKFASQNDLDGVRKAIFRGASPSITDDAGVPAVDYAAKYNNVEIMSLLLQRGAGVTERDALGNMPIHWAAQQGSLEVLQILLDNQSPVDPTNRDGMTPLMLAARGGQTAAARLLLAKGADPHKQDFTGRDALGWASQPAVRHLIEEKSR